jgi:hypothetical protein
MDALELETLEVVSLPGVASLRWRGIHLPNKESSFHGKWYSKVVQ